MNNMYIVDACITRVNCLRSKVECLTINSNRFNNYKASALADPSVRLLITTRSQINTHRHATSIDKYA